jgi:hypothetical protein
MQQFKILVTQLERKYVDSTRTFQPSQMKTLCCLETSGSNCPMIQRHIPEERNLSTASLLYLTMDRAGNVHISHRLYD